ncbi:MAG: hypothetical protein H6861_10010 [Rhodospirillales bacterium]|nr:hypothetical protein [Rhodospirillales bacterium]
MNPLIVCRAKKTKYINHIAEAMDRLGHIQKCYAYVAYYDDWRDYLQNDSSIEFESLFGTREVFSKIESETISVEEMVRIEKLYGDRQLWSLALTERWLFPQAAYPLYARTPYYSQEQKTKYFALLIKQAESIFDDHPVDCVIDFANIGIFRMALDVVAEKRGIPYYHIDSALVQDLDKGDRFFISRRLNDNYSFLEQSYQFYLKNPDRIGEGRQYLERFRAPQSYSAYSQWYGNETKPLSFAGNVFNRLCGFGKGMLKIGKAAVRDIRLHAKAMTNPEIKYNFSLYKSSALLLLARHIQSFYRTTYTKFFCKRIQDAPDYKYAFMTLHMQPEASTALMAPYEVNQLAVIENIAKALPFDYQLLVKLNKVMIGKDTVHFLRQLQQYPNVVLVDHFAHTRSFIEHAACIVTITGTVGFEGLLHGKKTILLGDQTMPWHRMAGVDNIKEWGNLHDAIRCAEQYKANDDELCAYLQAVHDHSFQIERNFVWDTKFDFSLENENYRKLTQVIAEQIVNVHNQREMHTKKSSKIA